MRAVYLWQCAKIAEHLEAPELCDGVLLAPISAFLRSKALPQRRAYVRSVAIGAQWPMARQWEAGYPVDPNCIACLAAGS
eukprot:7423551-Pyramimonas_sp.AAC.1